MAHYFFAGAAALAGAGAAGFAGAAALAGAGAGFVCAGAGAGAFSPFLWAAIFLVKFFDFLIVGSPFCTRLRLRRNLGLHYETRD
jgi:hypothetical protein